MRVTADDLVRTFHAGDISLGSAPKAEPEATWLAIVALSRQPLTEKQIFALAAGPMEDLLDYHGEAFIDRVEKEARVYGAFRHLLRGVWPSSISEPVWQRVQYLLGPPK